MSPAEAVVKGGNQAADNCQGKGEGWALDTVADKLCDQNETDIRLQKI